MATPPMTRPSPAAAQRILGRAAYGATPAALAALARDGTDGWLDRQLALPSEDAGVDRLLGRITARIYYADGPGEQIVQGERGLATLAMTQAERWAYVPLPSQRQLPQEIERGRLELALATLGRRAVAEAQLRERVVEFWHDHFSVYGPGSPQMQLSMPDHDARIRQHALGSFRQLLEAMAASPAMLFYLNNQSSRAGAPNENYARELLELHTLGREAYAGATRNWREVPRDATGLSVAYADADVWEVARAFTGWSVAAGQGLDGGLRLPRTGEFTYVEAWHDPYQKRILGRELDPFQPPLADGRAVLDLLAAHPATARFVARKLARFFLGEPVPQPAVARAEAAFRRHATSPDQIAQTVRALLAGPELASDASVRVRRPSDVALAAVRALEVDFIPRPQLLNELSGAGQLLFGWASPDGPPLDAAYHLSASALRRRWGMVTGLARNWWGTGASAVLQSLAGKPVPEAAARLSSLALGPDAEAVADTVATIWAEARRPPRPDAAGMGEVAGWVLAAPAFQAV